MAMTMRPAAAAPEARRGGIRLWATLLAGLVAAGVIAAPGSMAYLQAQQTSGGVSLATGSAGLAITPGSGADPALAPDGVPHLLNPLSPATITNTGDVPLELRVSLTASNTAAGSFGAATNFVVWLTTGACVVPSSIAPGMWVGTALAPVTTSLGTLAPSAQRTLCLAAGLSASAPSTAQMAGATFTVTVTGDQIEVAP